MYRKNWSISAATAYEMSALQRKTKQMEDIKKKKNETSQIQQFIS